MTTTREWQCMDGRRLNGEYVRAEAPRARVVIAPAMGVPRGFYRRFAKWLTSQGIDAATFDYRDQWGRWMRRPRYLFDDSGVDTRACRDLSLPVLADDDGHAPAEAIDALLREYSGLVVTRRQVAGLSQAVGHMGFFREPMRESVWQPTLDWIQATARAATQSASQACKHTAARQP